MNKKAMQAERQRFLAESNLKKRQLHLEKMGLLEEGQKLSISSRGYTLKLTCPKCGNKFQIPLSKLGKRRFCRMGCKHSKTLNERFFDKFKMTDKNKCWEWFGNRNPSGYGMIGYLATQVLAHRVSWEVHRGKIPKGLFVLHRCDNPPCVNPNHLFVGTCKDNAQDMILKGRKPDTSGSKNGMSKINEADALKIRRLSAAGNNFTKIGRRFGLCTTSVSNIVKRKKWSHVK
jgi:HNH endonuclease